VRAQAAGELSIRSWLLRVSLVAVLPMLGLLLGVTAWGLHVQAGQRAASLQRQAVRAADAVQGLLDVHLARIATVAAGVAARRLRLGRLVGAVARRRDPAPAAGAQPRAGRGALRRRRAAYTGGPSPDRSPPWGKPP